MDLDFKISTQGNNPGDSNQVSVQVWKLDLLFHDESKLQNNIWTAIDALHNINVVERLRVETTDAGALWRIHLMIVHLIVFEENKGSRNH
jgi:hypothetical protein